MEFPTTEYAPKRGLIERYRERLPVPRGARVVSLGEGGTPLLRLNNIPRAAGVAADIYVKHEGLNPTGSFKDRGMTMAVTQALAEGSRAIICASTGNTSAAAAAYAAQAGLSCFVLIPDGKIAYGKLAQSMLHGATTIQIKGNFDDGMALVKEVAQRAPVTLVNSTNPYRLQGQKTAAFEIIDALGRAPDYHCLPVGNAGNITAHWIGYCEYTAADGGVTTKACAFCGGDCRFAGRWPAYRRAVNQVRSEDPVPYAVSAAARHRPRPAMLGYQAAGAAPFLRGEMVDNPETVATAIRIGRPQSWDAARTVIEESDGWFGECHDEEILAAQKMLAAREGIFCEPASAASLAGLLNDLKAGNIADDSLVVCTLTGNGLKDPDTAMKQSGKPLKLKPTLGAVEDAIMRRLEK